MSDAFWMSFFSSMVAVIGLWLTYRKAEQAELAGKENSKKIDGVVESNKDQHVKTNSQLDEMKRVIAEKSHAEGVLLGKAELQALIDAKALAVVDAMKTAPAPGSTPTAPVNVTAPEPLPVRVVPASRSLPVVETPDPGKKK